MAKGNTTISWIIQVNSKHMFHICRNSESSITSLKSFFFWFPTCTNPQVNDARQKTKSPCNTCLTPCILFARGFAHNWINTNQPFAPKQFILLQLPEHLIMTIPPKGPNESQKSSCFALWFTDKTAPLLHCYVSHSGLFPAYISAKFFFSPSSLAKFVLHKTRSVKSEAGLRQLLWIISPALHETRMSHVHGCLKKQRGKCRKGVWVVSDTVKRDAFNTIRGCTKFTPF